MTDSQHQSDQAAEFFRLYSPIEHRIFSYILALVSNWADAEDVYQETSLFLWQRFDEFDVNAEGSDFMRWAMTIAFHRVQEHRRRKSRDRLMLSDEFVDRIASKIAATSNDRIELRLAALRKCLEKLGARDRDLLRLRYEASTLSGAIQAHAQRLGRPADSFYKALHRIRKRLLQCIKINLREGVE